MSSRRRISSRIDLGATASSSMPLRARRRRARPLGSRMSHGGADRPRSCCVYSHVRLVEHAGPAGLLPMGSLRTGTSRDRIVVDRVERPRGSLRHLYVLDQSRPVPLAHNICCRIIARRTGRFSARGRQCRQENIVLRGEARNRMRRRQTARRRRTSSGFPISNPARLHR